MYVNQYTGEILAVYNEKYDVFNILKYIHWGLLFNSEWGPYITGIPTVLFIIMLITGIILWWPKNKNARKGRFWFNWENVKNWKRKNYDLHNILGFYASFIALIMCVTGIYFAYPYVKNTFNLALSGSWELPKDKEIKSLDSLVVRKDAVFDIAAMQAEKLYPGSSSFRITLNGKNKKERSSKTFPLPCMERMEGLVKETCLPSINIRENYSTINLITNSILQRSTQMPITTSIPDLISDCLEKSFGSSQASSAPHSPLPDFWSGGEKEKNKERKYNEKAILSAACLGTTMAFAQVKDSLQTNNVDEVVMTASRKKREH